jgi:Zn-finger nucleic acid-binding protein
MNCPRDNAALRQVVRKGTTIDVCTGCHGKWLDQGELEQLVLSETRTGATAAALKSALAAVERPSFFHAAGSDPDLACPRCGIAMQKVLFETGGTELTADRCETCEGFWLDPGEAGSLFVFLEENLPVRGGVWALVAVAFAVGLFATYWLLAS